MGFNFIRPAGQRVLTLAPTAGRRWAGSIDVIDLCPLHTRVCQDLFPAAGVEESLKPNCATSEIESRKSKEQRHVKVVSRWNVAQRATLRAAGCFPAWWIYSPLALYLDLGSHELLLTSGTLAFITLRSLVDRVSVQL